MRRPAGNGINNGVGTRVGLTGVNNLDNDPLHRDDVLDLPLIAVNEHRILRGEGDGVSAVEALKHVTEPTWVSLRPLRPQAPAGGEERPNLAFNERVRLLGNPEASLIDTRKLVGGAEAVGTHASSASSSAQVGFFWPGTGIFDPQLVQTMRVRPLMSRSASTLKSRSARQTVHGLWVYLGAAMAASLSAAIACPRGAAVLDLPRSANLSITPISDVMSVSPSARASTDGQSTLGS